MSPDAGTADEHALAAATEALYAVPPEDFVAQRNARARQARQAGDRALSTAIGALPKPTVAAWLLNELARRRPDAVEELAALGDELRSAQRSLEGEQIRALTRTRQAVVAGFVRQVHALAAELDRPVGAAVAQQVEESLRAAVADEGAAHALRSGRLTTGLTYVGIGDVDVSAAPKAVSRTADAEAARSAERRERVAILRAELEQAEAGLAAAVERRRETERARDEARRTADEASAVVERARAQLDDALR